MSKSVHAGCLMTLAMLVGCSGDNMTAVKPPPPHGGNFVEIPGENAYVEVVRKAGASKGTSVSGEITFYFFKDESTPYTPAPTTGTLTYGKNKSVTLKPAADGLATPDGPSLFDGGEPDGTLTVQLGGKSVSIPLGVR